MSIKKEHGKIDWMITLVPLGIVIALCIVFFLFPDQSNTVLSHIRFFFGDTFGTYYLVIGREIWYSNNGTIQYRGAAQRQAVGHISAKEVRQCDLR